MTKYKKGSAWKRTHWDRWGFGRKVLHVFAVIGSLALSATMLVGFVWFILFLDEINFVEKLVHTTLLNFAHWLFD